MKLFVLFGQRKCEYPGQYALEALDCMDEANQSDNPGHLVGMRAKYEKSAGFDRLGIVELSVSEEDVRRVLYPEQQAIVASVVQPD